MGFRQQTQKMKEDLQKRVQESIDRGEDFPEYGSIYIKENIPAGVGFWKPSFGDHLIDCIPFICGPQHPRTNEGQMAYNIDTWIHQQIGASYSQFVCLQRMWNMPDPICTYMAGKHLPKKEFAKLSPKRRTFYLVWVHDTTEEEEKGIQIWEVAWWNFEKHIDEIAKSPKGGAPIPFSDYDIGQQIAFSIKKSGTFMDDSGKERDSVDYVGHRFIARDEPIPDEILDQSFSLDTCIIMKPDYETMETAFQGAQQAKHAETEQEQLPETPKDETKTQEEPKTQPKTQPKDSPDETASDAPFECPGGGTPGADIEKLPECAKCTHYDPCSDLADTNAEASAPPVEEEKESEAKSKKRILRRRR